LSLFYQLYGKDSFKRFIEKDTGKTVEEYFRKFMLSDETSINDCRNETNKYFNGDSPLRYQMVARKLMEHLQKVNGILKQKLQILSESFLFYSKMQFKNCSGCLGQSSNLSKCPVCGSVHVNNYTHNVFHCNHCECEWNPKEEWVESRNGRLLLYVNSIIYNVMAHVNSK